MLSVDITALYLLMDKQEQGRLIP
nr:unnamed protein product [Callosobruchus analis]